MNKIRIQPLTPDAFAPYGDVLDCTGDPDRIINQGNCGRYHNRAKLDFVDGQAGISLFKAKARDLPYKLEMVERHPQGSQAFIPMHMSPFLITVAQNVDKRPRNPLAFVSQPGQGINFHKNVWHGVLTPLSEPGLFAVVDRIGTGDNLEEYWFDDPYLIADA